MVIDINGKITEATAAEMFRQYLKAGWDDLMDFNEFCRLCVDAGTKITDMED